MRMLGRACSLALVLMVEAWCSASAPVRAGEKHDLRYHFAPGQQLKYRYYLVGKTIENGQTSPIRVQYQALEEVTAADPEAGLFTLAERAEKVRGTVFDAHGFGLLVAGEVIERQVDAQGRVKSAAGYAPGSRYYLRWLILPGNTVAVGDFWKFSGALAFTLRGQDLPTPCTILYSLDKITPYKGRPCAKIRLQGSYQAVSKSGDLVVLGTITGWAFFDLERGVIKDLKIQETQKQKVKSESWAKSVEYELTALQE
jgi:hypothetical protein